jgi:hypothetical protein
MSREIPEKVLLRWGDGSQTEYHLPQDEEQALHIYSNRSRLQPVLQVLTPRIAQQFQGHTLLDGLDLVASIFPATWIRNLLFASSEKRQDMIDELIMGIDFQARVEKSRCFGKDTAHVPFEQLLRKSMMGHKV